MMKLRKKKNQPPPIQKTTSTSKDWHVSATLDLKAPRKQKQKWMSIFRRKKKKKGQFPPVPPSPMIHSPTRPPPSTSKPRPVPSTPSILNRFLSKLLNRSTTARRETGYSSLRMIRKQGVGRRLSK